MGPTDEETLIKRGDKGDAVARWQAFCAIRGFDPRGGVDGDFGSGSSVATTQLQEALGLVGHGVVDRATMRRAVELGFVGEVPVVPAKNFTRAGRSVVHWIVFHTMEAPEKGTTAEAVARYFATSAPASAHYNVDADSIVQSVAERDVAWHAPYANRFGIGVEHAGYARQTPAEWADDYSTATLRRSAQLVALLCVRWGIPPVLVDAAGLRAKQRGITTHKAVTDAFSGGAGHWDPGPAWPGEWYCSLVREAMGHACPVLPAAP